MTHIGILLCDDHRPYAIKRFGTYDNHFKAMLAEEEQAQQKCSVWRCFEGNFPVSAKQCDSWIISGSKWGVYDSDSWIKTLRAFIQNLDEIKTNVVGICFGHQIIHDALGGQVAKSEKGWGIGAYPVKVYEQLGSIAPGDSLKLLAIHQDQVQSMAYGFTHIAGCSFTPYAITRKGSHILTFQAHPEFNDGFYQDLCENIREKLGREALKKVKATRGQPDDRQIIRQVIRDFLL
ncbi:MAG: type 1 glutamine amidotransferase [Endozoicomonas sp. (ex Botrylloides leachii)]|nr:type 1 glutamine amidotransferase [Endozoicomonas sp. (ex Botrylloides leachii)]